MSNVVEIARKYLGQTEISGNKGFNDKVFEKRMKDVGWLPGLAWCSFLGEMIWREAYPFFSKDFDKLFSGSATTTYKNFEQAGWPVGQVPKVGALVVWRLGTGWQGHLGVVTTENIKSFTSVEGNTNDGKSREGYIVAEHPHIISKTLKPNGLNLVGFVYPKEQPTPDPKSLPSFDIKAFWPFKK